jgi:two-component system cell cycle sensor histidine kinase/response regulator CckA
MTSAEFVATPRPYGVLIADDEADVREVLHDKLRQVGFSVWLAADGQEALDVYRTHRETIDVALLDVCMPGLDGPRTLAALQEITPQIRCCFMSGYLGNHVEKDLCGTGAARVFAKPFRLDEVARVIGQLARRGNVSLGQPEAVQRCATEQKCPAR